MERARLASHLARQSLDALVGVALTVAGFVLVETALWAAGAGAAAPPLELSRGFDPDAAYFVPDPEKPRSWRTQFVGARVEFTIPPKSGRKRILLFGGSNTASFRQLYLARELERELGWPKRRVEVVNLGRSGYGSARVAILFRQALELLEPDGVVVYTGHNEFVERSFALDLDRAWSSRWVRDVAEWLQGTRTGSVLRSLAADGDRGDRHGKPEEWEAEYKKFLDLRLEQTEAAWDAYEENLRFLCAEARSRGVPMLLSTVVYNRFSRPRVDTPTDAVSAADREAVAVHLAAAAEHYPEHFVHLLPLRDQDRVHGFDWGGPKASLPEGERQPPLPGLRPSLGELAGRDTRQPRERPWEPKVRELYEALALLHAGAPAGERAALERAAAELDAALALFPDNPRALYERALVAYCLGERGEPVRRLFEDAARWDRAPRNANELSNARVRQVAAEFPEVLLFDADRWFAERSQDGLVGWEWMSDHCHLNPGAVDVLMELFAREIAGHWFAEERDEGSR